MRKESLSIERGFARAVGAFVVLHTSGMWKRGMNWLSNLLFRDSAAFDASGKPVRRARFERFRHFARTRRAKAKSAWKKLSKKTRRVVATWTAVAILACLVTSAVLAASYIRRTEKPPDAPAENLDPAPSAPVLPPFEKDSVATDPAAAPRRWKYIVVHHSGGSTGSAQSFDTYHRETKGWQSLGYHFVIGNGKGQGDGKVEAGPRWYAQQAGAHAHSAEHNEFGIGICLVGNFDVQSPTPAQWHSLVELVKNLSTEYAIPLANIVGHNQIRQGGSTACPGKNLNLQALRDAISAP